MCAMVTRTLTINAAFLQEIKEDHRELQDLLLRCRYILCPPDLTTKPEDLVRLLGRLRDQLGMHFSLEEAYGYFEDAVAEAPRLSNEADVLRNEHNVLFQRLCQLVERAEELLYGHLPPRKLYQLADAFALFDEAFRDHELRETQLILAALQDDLGVGD